MKSIPSMLAPITSVVIALTAVALLLAASPDARADGPTPAMQKKALDATGKMQTVLAHYEIVRVALLHDSLDGVAESTRLIDAGLDVLHDRFDPASAAVDPASTDSARALLAEARAASEELASATDLASTRNAFYELTKPLVRYRELMVGEKPVVAYCPMARKSWLQPAGEIGNPYHGQSMASCGSVVSSDGPHR